MALRYARGLWLLVCVALVPQMAVAAEGRLNDAYAAILNGNYQSSRDLLNDLAKKGSNEAASALDWLTGYQKLITERDALKAETFEWNAKQAKDALAAGNIRLALTFAASQAAPYAKDLAGFGQEPWVTDLAERCRTEAKKAVEERHYETALSYYALLGRIYPDDKSLEELREDAARHARIELIYRDEKTLKEHLEGVTRDILRRALSDINRLYWKPPDFRKAAGGALDNLLTLTETSSLYDFMHGLANPDLREAFVKRLKELRAAVNGEGPFTQEHMLKLFNDIAKASKETVELPNEMLVVEFMEGADLQLDDYTAVIWPSEAQDFEKVMMGGFEGVGIQLGLDERSSRLKVVTPLENSPALEAGVQPDDLIVGVNDEDTNGWSTDDAVRNIMGPAGSSVVLTIFRPSTGEHIPFKLSRRKIELTSVRGVKRDPADPNKWDYMLDPANGVAYIRLTNFMPRSAAELVAALDDARHQGMQGLVLDVRHNPGGLLEVAIDIISNFVPPDSEVVATRGRHESEEHHASGGGRFKDLPLVVLVNEGSASASEILAGALQDYGRAIVLGERTFGKGSVQHVRPIPGSDARLKLTTALYYLPSGRSPHKAPDAETWGVDPTVKLELTPKEFRKVIERERESYVIANKGQGSGSNHELTEEEREKAIAALKANEKEKDKDKEPPFLSEEDIQALEADPNKAPAVDPQLETALLLIRVKLAADVPWPRELAAVNIPTQKN